MVLSCPTAATFRATAYRGCQASRAQQSAESQAVHSGVRAEFLKPEGERSMCLAT